MHMCEILKTMYRNVISLHFEGEPTLQIGETRFGGQPDVPSGFVWPTFETATYEDDAVKPRPLSFLAQFNCAGLAPLDLEGLLPKSGLLSFFYEADSQRWGFDPKDAGCAKVYWFEDTSSLSPAEFPDELSGDFRFPSLQITARSEKNLPDWEDFSLAHEKLRELYDDFSEERVLLGHDTPEESSKLLGWPDIIQSNMTNECELVTRGHYLGGTWDNIPVQDVQLAEKTSLDNWLLLFQLDTVTSGDFELMFGDCGRLYFYIRKEDLQQRRFERVWTILQCY